MKWALLSEYDVQALESTDWSIPQADAEVSERLQRRALFNKHLAKAEDGAQVPE